MKKWSVIGIVTASKHLGEFEAETNEEAIEAALGSANNSFSLCHQCAGKIELTEYCCNEAVAEELKSR